MITIAPKCTVVEIGAWKNLQKDGRRQSKRCLLRPTAGGGHNKHTSIGAERQGKSRIKPLQSLELGHLDSVLT